MTSSRKSCDRIGPVEGERKISPQASFRLKHADQSYFEFCPLPRIAVTYILMPRDWICLDGSIADRSSRHERNLCWFPRRLRHNERAKLKVDVKHQMKDPKAIVVGLKM